MIEQQGILNIVRADFMYNEQDFIALMRQDQDRIYRLAFHLLGSEEEAKDATQEVFVKAWKGLQALRRDTSRAWLSKITVNLCLDWMRRRKFRGEIPEEKDETQDSLEHQLPAPDPDPLEECLSDEAQTTVRAAVARLAPKYRTVVILRDLEGLSYQEIADILNIRLSKVKSNLFRARRELREILRPFFEVSQ